MVSLDLSDVQNGIEGGAYTVVSIPRAAIVRQIGFCDPTYVDAIDEALRGWLAL